MIQEAYLVMVKRQNGGEPLLSKAVGEGGIGRVLSSSSLLFHSLEDAEDHIRCNTYSSQSYGVFRIHVEIQEEIT